MKKLSRVRALLEATHQATPIFREESEWAFQIEGRTVMYPTYYQARDGRAQAIAELAARKYLRSRSLPDGLMIPDNICGSSAARFRVLLDALPEFIKTEL